MAQALYREWRPLTWSEVIGQEHVVRTLRNSVRAERLSHAYLFSGPRGTGKTSTARILAKAANCLAESLEVRPCNECEACVAVNEGRYLDLIEIDAASNTSVDDVRDLRERINFAPNEGRYKVYIVDEVHMLSTAAFNALLKTLEEPPPHAIFVLATTEVHKVPATVLSRCQRHEFRRIPVDEIDGYLEEKVQKSGYEVEPEALTLIARQATGSLRDAVSLLDQLVSMGEKVTLEQAQEVLGTAVDEAVDELVQALADGEARAGLEIINQAIDGGIDPRQFARQVVEWLRTILLINAGEKADGRSKSMVRQAKIMGTERILPAMRAFSQATRGERAAWQPGLALELAFMDSIQSSTESDTQTDEAPSVSRSKPSSEIESETEQEPPADQPEAATAPNIEDESPSSVRDANTPAAEDETPPSAREAKAPIAEDEARDSANAEAESRHESQPSTDFQSVLNAWPDLLAAAYARDPQAQALLNSCKPLGVDDDALVLGFQSDLLREKMEKGHNQEIVSEALGQVMNAKMEVRCVLLKDWGGDRTEAPSPPLPEGGMVAAALRDLGAEVTDYGPEIEVKGLEASRETSAEDDAEEEER